MNLSNQKFFSRKFCALAILAAQLIAFSPSTHAQVVSTDPVDDLVSTESSRMELIEAYGKSPAAVSGNRLLATGISFVMAGNLERAEEAFKKYVDTNSSNPRAYRGLGNICMMQGRLDEATGYFKIGWKLKDVDSLRTLSVALLSAEKPDEVRKLLPDLLANKDKNIEIVNVLMALAVEEPQDKELFLKAFSGLPVAAALSREDTALLILQGYYAFDMKDKADQWEAQCTTKGYDISKVASFKKTG